MDNYNLYIKTGDKLTIDFMRNNKSYRLFIDVDTIKLCEIIENIDNKCVINMEEFNNDK